MTTLEDIYFWGINNIHGYMSNFYPCKFIENNITFNCSEQYFMYYKLLQFDKDNIELKDKIINETSPKIIKKYGRQVKNFNQQVWDNVKYNIMKNGLNLKFSQNKNLKKKLLDTGNCNIYEASPYDKIWGIGLSEVRAKNTNKTKYGQNLLGKALVDVRTQLKKKN